jgi:hypothetical protein
LDNIGETGGITGNLTGSLSRLGYPGAALRAVTIPFRCIHQVYLWRIFALVKRLQIYIDENVDRALGVEARRQRKSKAALIREYVAERLREPGPDPVDAFIGSFDGGADLSASVDDVVYGKRE